MRSRQSCPLNHFADLCLLHSQGYAFKVITALEGLEDTEDLVYKTKAEQIELLQSVLLANESEADIGSDMRGSALAGDFDQHGTPAPSASSSGRRDGAGKATRVAGSLQALAGYVSSRTSALGAIADSYFDSPSRGQSMAYTERNTSMNKQLAKDQQKKRHKLFDARDQKRKGVKKRD